MHSVVWGPGLDAVPPDLSSPWNFLGHQATNVENLQSLCTMAYGHPMCSEPFLTNTIFNLQPYRPSAILLSSTMQDTHVYYTPSGKQGQSAGHSSESPQACSPRGCQMCSTLPYSALRMLHMIQCTIPTLQWPIYNGTKVKIIKQFLVSCLLGSKPVGHFAVNILG